MAESTFHFPLAPLGAYDKCFDISVWKRLKNKHHHSKVLLCSFRVNGYTWGFHPQTRTLKITNSTTGKYCSVAFIWMVTLYSRISSTGSKVRITLGVQHSEQYYRKVLLSRSHFSISSTDSKVKLTLYSIMNNSTHQKKTSIVSIFFSQHQNLRANFIVHGLREIRTKWG